MSLSSTEDRLSLNMHWHLIKPKEFQNPFSWHQLYRVYCVSTVLSGRYFPCAAIYYIVCRWYLVTDKLKVVINEHNQFCSFIFGSHASCWTTLAIMLGKKEEVGCAVRACISVQGPYSLGLLPYITNEPLAYWLPALTLNIFARRISLFCRFHRIFLGTYKSSSAAKLRHVSLKWSVMGPVLCFGPEGPFSAFSSGFMLCRKVWQMCTPPTCRLTDVSIWKFCNSMSVPRVFHIFKCGSVK